MGSGSRAAREGHRRTDRAPTGRRRRFGGVHLSARRSMPPRASPGKRGVGLTRPSRCRPTAATPRRPPPRWPRPSSHWRPGSPGQQCGRGVRRGHRGIAPSRSSTAWSPRAESSRVPRPRCPDPSATADGGRIINIGSVNADRADPGVLGLRDTQRLLSQADPLVAREATPVHAQTRSPARSPPT